MKYHLMILHQVNLTIANLYHHVHKKIKIIYSTSHHQNKSQYFQSLTNITKNNESKVSSLINKIKHETKNNLKVFKNMLKKKSEFGNNSHQILIILYPTTYDLNTKKNCPVMITIR